MVYGLVAVSLILILVSIYYFGEGKCDLKKARAEFEIYGLSSGFVPQGLCYSKDLDCFLMSGYAVKGKPSRVYVIDAKTGKLLKQLTVTSNAKEEVSHFGGITSFGTDVWISTEGRVLRIKTADIKNAKDGESVSVFDSFYSKNGADFCFVNSGLLWIGEFYKLGKYTTDIAHHVKLDSKNQFHAMCYAYKIMTKNVGGVEKNIPEKALAIPDLAQGIAITPNEIYLSASYGLAKSSLMVFENVLNKIEVSSTVCGGKKIPLYFLSKDKLKRKYTLPSMSEEVEYHDGRVYVLFESASKKYRLFTRRKTKNIFSFSVNNF